jgi:hypothetical protein
LKPGQRLLGGGPPVILQSATHPALAALPSVPRISNTFGATHSGNAVDLAHNTEVANLVIDGSYRSRIYGLNVTSVSVHGNDVSGNNTSGTIGFAVTPTTLPTARRARRRADGKGIQPQRLRSSL